jgi:hypothetical protein
MEGSVKKLKVDEIEEELNKVRQRVLLLWGKIVHTHSEKEAFLEHVHCLMCICDGNFLTEFKHGFHAGDIINGLFSCDHTLLLHAEQYMLGVN